MIKDLQEFIVGKCKICKGGGFVDSEECSCVKYYRILVSMQSGGFPNDFILLASDKDFEEVVEIKKGKEFWDWSLKNWNAFIEKGLSLVLCGENLDIVSSYFVYKLLELDYRITCIFNPGFSFEEWGDVAVFTEFSDKTYDILEKRKKNVLSSIVCLEYLSFLKEDLRLAEIVGFEKNKFTDGIYRACEVVSKKIRSGWKI
jgi:hypothetical protein